MAVLPCALRPVPRASVKAMAGGGAERAGPAALSLPQWTAARQADQACQAAPRNPAARRATRRSQRRVTLPTHSALQAC